MTSRSKYAVFSLTQALAAPAACRPASRAKARQGSSTSLRSTSNLRQSDGDLFSLCRPPAKSGFDFPDVADGGKPDQGLQRSRPSRRARSKSDMKNQIPKNPPPRAITKTRWHRSRACPGLVGPDEDMAGVADLSRLTRRRLCGGATHRVYGGVVYASPILELEIAG